MNSKHLWRAVAVVAALTLTACEGPPGETGEQGPPGQDGQDGQPGLPGDAGVNAHPGYAATTGLKLDIQQVTVANDGTVNATFVVTDGNNVALDRTGALSVGAVSSSFILAKLQRENGEEPGKYVAYTIRNVAIPDGGGATVVNATAENLAGNYTELSPGRYNYKFSAKVTDGVESQGVYAIGVYATRTVDGVRYVANEVYHFDGTGAVITDAAKTRDNIRTDSCNRCHGRLEAHGGARRDFDMCELCHTPQTSDADTGRSVDMMEMIHKIHYGHDLPSNVAGDHYTIIGYGGAVHDYSGVALPPTNTVQNCETCHSKFAADAGVPTQLAEWKSNTEITVPNCQSCHDRTWFGATDAVPTGWTMHAGGPAQTPSNCASCHAVGTMFGTNPVGVDVAHLTGRFDPAQPKPALKIDAVTATPGNPPVIDFTVLYNGAPRDISQTANYLTTLRATWAGNTNPDWTDISTYVNQAIQSRNFSTGATTLSGTLEALDAAAGKFRWTAPGSALMPANAHGTWYFTLEGYQTASSAGVNVNYPWENERYPVKVTGGGAATARRDIVDDAKCDACHYNIVFHGGSRTTADYCSACHNPRNMNDERISRVEGQDIFVHSVDAKVMIHKIHMGEELSNKPYVLGANPSPSTSNSLGAPHDFGETLYPNNPARCEACHVPNSYKLPLVSGIAPSTWGTFTCTETTEVANSNGSTAEDTLCEPFTAYSPGATAPADAPTSGFILKAGTLRQQEAESAVCTSCHDSPYAESHAETMTWMGIESCATCHGPGTDFDVAKVHQVAP